ncbi:MAG: hypothetical protein RLZZ342_408 [Candidatus Parcubacteria bacterium]|jgi:murein DD-endopeptidase MepM/ murein hydrolase activator NlpD
MRKVVAILFAIFFALPMVMHAQSADELRAQIADHNAQIEKLDKEIAQFEKELVAVGGKKKTLQNTISSLNITIKKTTATINVTKNKIGATELEIRELAGDIADRETLIAHQKSGIAASLRTVAGEDDRSLIEQTLSEDTLAETWRVLDAAAEFQESMQERISTLSKEKERLATSKAATESKRAELLKQKQTLLAQQGSLTATKQSQNELLAATKSQEAEYQRILKEKKAQQSTFEGALTDLKSKLAVAIDPSSITPAGKGVLRWPTDTVRVTQYFGNTAFAASGAYKGKGHNGIDIGVPNGTPLKAALSGTVVGTGNTDSVRGCYSFGKWVLIKHGNGLSTLYAHLSKTAVSAGQQVSTGQLIGYSGETGYATGPHLHFGVYVSSATQIMKLGDATNSKSACSSATMPIAPLSAYLNPMNYL